MSNAVTIRVGVYDPGLSEPDRVPRRTADSHLDRLATTLAPMCFDLIGLLQVPCAPDAHHITDQLAARLKMPWKATVPSPFYDHAIVVLARPGTELSVVAEHRQLEPPWTNGLGDLEVGLTHRTRHLRFLVGQAPSGATARLTEAERIAAYRDLEADIIYVADCRTAGLGETPDTSRATSDHATLITDTRPASLLQLAGFSDVGELTGDCAPTVGHHPADPVAFRQHRIYTTLPASTISGHGVVDEDRPLSRYRPVWAEFTLPSDDSLDPESTA